MAKYSTKSPNPPTPHGSNPRHNFRANNHTPVKISHVTPRPTNPRPKTGTDMLRESEKNAISHQPRPITPQGKSFYSGSGRSSENNSPKVRFLGSKKSFATMMIIMALIGGGMAFIGGSHTTLGPALDYAISQQTDTQYAATERASSRIITRMATGKQTIAGSSKTMELPAAFKTRLANQGIEVSGGNFVFKGKNIPASQLNNALDTDLDFRKAYTTAKRGRILGYFDNATHKILNKFGVKRNIYEDYRQTSDAEADIKNYNEIEENKLNSSHTSAEAETESRREEYEIDESTGQPKTDEDGNPVLKYKDEVDGSTGNVSSESKPRAEAEVQAKKFIGDIASNVQQVVNWGCTAVTLGNVLAMSIAAASIYNSIQLFTSNTENTSKMKAGFGSESAYHPFMNKLTREEESTVEDYSSAKVSGSVAAENISIELGTKTEKKAATQSNFFQLVLAGVAPNLSQTENYSRERVIKLVGGAIGGTLTAATSANMIKNCANAQLGTSIASLAVTLIPGVGEVHIIGKIVAKVAIGGIAILGMGALFNFLIPTISKTLINNAYTELAGAAFGEEFGAGAYATNSRLGQSGNGQVPGSEAVANQYNRLNDQAIAQENELDRLNRSPFDITSKNTFLGSIAYSLFPLTGGSKSSALTTLVNTTSRSIANLSNKTFAAPTVQNTYTSFYGSCPELESIGAKGDIYCNPIIVSDTSTLTTGSLDSNSRNLASTGNAYAITSDSYEVDQRYHEVIADNTECDSEGDCVVRENSELDIFINTVAGRESPFGFADMNIINALSATTGVLGDGKIGTAISAFLSATPVIDDFIDIIESDKTKENLKWATGEKCVASPDNDYWNDTCKYFQQYMTENRVIENLEGFSSSSSSSNNSQSDDTTQTLGNVNEEKVTINIPGLSKDYKIAWVSDLHLIADGTKYVDDTRYNMFKTSDGIHSGDYLDTIINYLNNGGFDAVIFGGDMLDYYSTENYNTLRQGLSQLNMPWFYIYGAQDHDKETGHSNESVASDLTSDSSSGSGDVIDLGEFKIVGLNNSADRNITSGELNSVASNIQNAGKPVILATHVPFDSTIDSEKSSLKNQVTSNHNGDVYYWSNDSSRWNIGGNSAMQSFLTDNVYNDGNVKAVLAGHVHEASIDTKLTDNVKQHIFQGGFKGNVGVITVTGNNTANNETKPSNLVSYDIPSKNPVIASQERWLEKHPIDDSPAGYLSRIAGITKEDASLVFDVIAYYDFLNDYDASSRLAMDGDASEIKDGATVVAEIESQKNQNHPIIGSGEEAEECAILVSQTPVYADIRNRSFAA